MSIQGEGNGDDLGHLWGKVSPRMIGLANEVLAHAAIETDEQVSDLIARFENDPPRTEFDRGFLSCLLIVQEALGTDSPCTQEHIKCCSGLASKILTNT